LYNWNLRERIEAYEKTGTTVSYYDQQNALPQLKKDRPWFKSVYSLVLQDVLRRLDKSFKTFFAKTGGFPNYKKHGQWNSITYADHRAVPVDGYVQVAKVGELKIKCHRDLPSDAAIKTLTIIKDGGKWFVCFSLDLPDRPESKREHATVMAMDLGLSSFIYTTDGVRVDHPRFLKHELKDLKRLQRQLARTKKGSVERRKVIEKLQKRFYRIKCKRKDFCYKLAHELLLHADIIVHEDLAIKNMVRRPKPKLDDSGEYIPNGAGAKSGLNRSIHDAGWGMFVRILAFVASKQGKQVLAVSPRYTSQACSNCGVLVPKTLATRVHSCTSCGYQADRDYNAARNILRLGLESLGKTDASCTLEAPIQVDAH